MAAISSAAADLAARVVIPVLAQFFSGLRSRENVAAPEKVPRKPYAARAPSGARDSFAKRETDGRAPR
jgi:hypothetical protein